MAYSPEWVLGGQESSRTRTNLILLLNVKDFGKVPLEDDHSNAGATKIA